MANDFEVRVGVSVDESELKELEKRLLDLKNNKGKIDVDVDTEGGQQKVKALYNALQKTFKNLKISPTLDTSSVRNVISEVTRLMNQMNRISSTGIDPSMFLTGSEKTLRQISETFRRIPDQALQALKDAQAGAALSLGDYIGNDSIKAEVKDFISNLKSLNSSSETYFDDIISTANRFKLNMSSILKEVSTDITQTSNKFTNLEQTESGYKIEQNRDKIRENATVDFADGQAPVSAEAIDKATAAMIEFNNAGEKTQNTIKEIDASFEVMEGAADVFQKAFNKEQQFQIYNVIKNELDKVGVALDDSERDLSEYINSVKARFDQAGKLISASISASIKGADISAVFSPLESQIFGKDGLKLSGASIVTSQTKALQNLQKEYNTIIALQKELYRSPENADIINRQLSEHREAAEAIKEQIKNQEELNRVTQEYEDKIQKIENSQQKRTQDQQDANYIKNVSQALNTLEQLQSKINSLQNNGKLNTNQIEGYKQQIQEIISAFQELGITYDSVTNKFSFDTLNTNGLLNSAESIDKLINKLKEFQVATANTENKQLDFVDNQKVENAIQLLEQLKKKQLELEKAQSSNASSSYIDALVQDINRLEQELEQAKQEMLSFNQAVGESDNYQTAFSNAINDSATAMAKLESSAQRAQSSTSDLSNGFDGVISRCASMAASFAIFDQLQNALYSSVDAVKELDSAMTSLQMVTEQSDESIQNMMNGYADMANELGVTLKTVAEGSEEWLRQGFSTDQTEELLKASTMLSTIGDMGADEASEALTAVLNGFNMQSSAAMEVVDTLNALDLAYATSSQELATGMQRVASVAESAGVEFQDLASIMTVVSSTTRLSAETVGNGLKSLFSRLQNIKVGKYVDDLNQPLNDVEKTLNSLGIALRNSAEDWRDPKHTWGMVA